MKPIFFLFAGLPLFLFACAPSVDSAARTRAASELSCPQDAIQSREIAPGTVEMTGCGQRVVYTCPRSGRAGRVCIREAAASR
jgi:hypothetical protein